MAVLEDDVASPRAKNGSNQDEWSPAEWCTDRGRDPQHLVAARSLHSMASASSGTRRGRSRTSQRGTTSMPSSTGKPTRFRSGHRE